MFKLNTGQLEHMETDALEAFLVEMEGWAAANFGPMVAALPPGTVRR